jgi:hypothetical protein
LKEYFYAYEATISDANVNTISTNPNFTYGAIFGGMCRALTKLPNLEAIRTSTSNYRICMDIIYTDTGNQDKLDVGDKVKLLLGFQRI